jgi:hypothetical protein
MALEPGFDITFGVRIVLRRTPFRSYFAFARNMDALIC